MSKKKKGKFSDEFRTCMIAMALFLVIGTGLIIYGKLWNDVSDEDIQTVTATISDIIKVPSDNSKKTKESLLENGYTQEEVNYDFEIEYEFTLNGEMHTHIERTDYRHGIKLKVGDTAELKYTVKNGEVIVNPSKNGLYTGFGITFLAFGVLAGVCAFILRPGSRSKKK